MTITVSLTSKGGVPGGHYVLGYDGKSDVHVPSMRECHSVALRYSDVVVDIGAWCGTYALWAARLPVKRVVAYEPTPATFEILARTKLPNFTPRREAIVGDDRKSVELHLSAGIGVTNSLVVARPKAAVERVPARRYEEAVLGASVVKIDVEGAEYGYDLVQPGIRALIVDFHPIAKRDWVLDAEKMISKIEGAGFRPIIRPSWKSGWNRAGSWIRDLETYGDCASLMLGEQCCGCGAELSGAGSRALCDECYARWSPKQRTGFARGRRR